jgi:hypothetical protein
MPVARGTGGVHFKNSPANNLVHWIAVASEAAVVDVNGLMGHIVAGDKHKVVPGIDVGDDDMTLFQLQRDVAYGE